MSLTQKQLDPPDAEDEEQEPIAGDTAMRFHLKEPEKSPATLLNDAKQQLALARRRADILLGDLEMKPFEVMPPRIADEPSQLQLLKCLDDTQEAIWKTIQTFVDETGHPYHFTRSRLYQQIELEQQDAVKLQSTLDLLTQLGVIVRVAIDPQVSQATNAEKNSLTTKGVVYYRLVTSHDIVSEQESLHS